MSDSVFNLPDQSSGRTGLLATHLALIAGDTAHDLKEAQEVERMRSHVWPPLALPRRSHWMTIPVLLLAASLALIIGRLPEERLDLTIKGTTKLFTVLERSGKTRLLVQDEPLRAGDRINIEIAAGEHLKAFMGVFDRKGVELSARSDIIANSLEISAGKKGYFKSGLELTAENDGEQILVVTCNFEAWSKRFRSPEAFLDVYFKARLSPAAIDDTCQSQMITLRK